MISTRGVWCYLVATWSGFFVMLVELLSGRLIAPYFGNSIYVWGSIIFVFMLGLAIGYLLGGFISARHASLRWLAGMLAAAALVTIPTVIFATPLLEAIFNRIEDPRSGSLSACFALFLLPSILSGMISPYAVRILVHDTQSSGRSAGYLYFFSTLGSSAGTLMTSFYLVLWFEVNTIFLGAIGISLGLALITAVFGAGRSQSA